MRRDLHSGDLDVIVLFVTDQASLRKEFPAAVARLDPNGGLWVAWPKKASGIATDVTEDRVREVALAAASSTTKCVQSTRCGPACAACTAASIARADASRCMAVGP